MYTCCKQIGTYGKLTACNELKMQVQKHQLLSGACSGLEKLKTSTVKS